MDQQRIEAMRLKAIFYSDEFIERFGDWLSASKEFYSLDEQDQTSEQKLVMLKKYNITIKVDKNFEPRPTEEVMRFVYAEYCRIYVVNN